MPLRRLISAYLDGLAAGCMPGTVYAQLASDNGKSEVAKMLCKHGARGALWSAAKNDLQQPLQDTDTCAYNFIPWSALKGKLKRIDENKRRNESSNRVLTQATMAKSCKEGGISQLRSPSKRGGIVHLRGGTVG